MLVGVWLTVFKFKNYNTFSIYNATEKGAKWKWNKTKFEENFLAFVLQRVEYPFASQYFEQKSACVPYFSLIEKILSLISKV